MGPSMSGLLLLACESVGEPPRWSRVGVVGTFRGVAQAFGDLLVSFLFFTLYILRRTYVYPCKILDVVKV